MEKGLILTCLSTKHKGCAQLWHPARTKHYLYIHDKKLLSLMFATNHILARGGKAQD